MGGDEVGKTAGFFGGDNTGQGQNFVIAAGDLELCWQVTKWNRELDE